MKRFKMIMAITMIVTCFCATYIQASAAATELYKPIEIISRYNNTQSTIVNLSIATNGRATIDLSCNGYAGNTSKIVVRSYIEKKFGLLWFKVNNGQDKNEWVDTVYGSHLNITHYTSLSNSGNYRLTAIFTVYGSGATDTIERTMTRVY